MKKKLTSAAVGLMLLGVAGMATSLHIQANPDPSAATTGLTSGDWSIGAPGLAACESDGPDDPRNENVVPLNGINGLCTTGETFRVGHDASHTGVAPPGVRDTADYTTGMRPGAGEIVRFDLCTATVVDRFTGTLFSRCNAATVGDTGILGTTDDVAFSARVVGTTGMQCLVPVSNHPDPATGLVNQDIALYYDSLFAWWHYDGTGDYTADTAPPTRSPGDAAPFEEAGYHGHVVAFYDRVESRVGTGATGSAEAFLFDEDDLADALVGPGALDMMDRSDDTAAQPPWANPDFAYVDDCGGSPSRPPSGVGKAASGNDLFGPIFTAPYDVRDAENRASELGALACPDSQGLTATGWATLTSDPHPC